MGRADDFSKKATLMEPIIELKKEVGRTLPQRPDMPILPSEWHKRKPVQEAIVFTLILFLLLGIGMLTGMKIAAPEEIRQKDAWEVQVSTYNECFKQFVQPIPIREKIIRRTRSESCLEVAEVAMDERYKAGMKR